jgi:hypothetical protein
MKGMFHMSTSEGAQAARCQDELCAVCHCTDEGCDGTVCHGLDAD